MPLLEKIFRWVDQLLGRSNTQLASKGRGRGKNRPVATKKSASGAGPRKSYLKIKKQGGAAVKKKASVRWSRKVKVLPLRRTKGSKTIKSEARPIGEITHYFDKIRVCVLRIDFGTLKKGDQICINSKNAQFFQTIDSMQIENEDVASAKKGQMVGLKVKEVVAVGSKVSCVKAKGVFV